MQGHRAEQGALAVAFAKVQVHSGSAQISVIRAFYDSTGELIAEGLVASNQSTSYLVSLPGGRNVDMQLVVNHTSYFALPVLKL